MTAHHTFTIPRTDDVQQVKSCASVADLEALAATHDEIVFAEPVFLHGHMWFRIIAVIDGEEYEDTQLLPSAAWNSCQRQAWQAKRSRKEADAAVAGLARYFGGLAA